MDRGFLRWAAALAGTVLPEGGRKDWQGVVFLDGEEGRIYGRSAAPTDRFTVPAGRVLRIGPRQTLTLRGEAALINRGSLSVAPGGKLLPGEALPAPRRSRPDTDAPDRPA